MEPVLALLAVIMAVITAGTLAAAAGPLRHTTLFAAWTWGLAFSLLSLMLVTLDGLFGLLPGNWSEILWYVAAIVGLCTPVAVLGARRPVNRIWNLFVILPLLAVLGWPAMTVLIHGLPPHRLQLEAPPLVAFGLVLLMGYGNYIGTRYGWCVVLAALGEGLLVAPLAAAAPSASLRPLGVICIGAGTILARIVALRPKAAIGLDHVWQDFRNSFGIVWSRRIMERFNQQARQQHWRVRLEPRGFLWECEPDAQHRIEAERFLRWLLRRFVDDTWLEARIGSSPS